MIRVLELICLPKTTVDDEQDGDEESGDSGRVHQVVRPGHRHHQGFVRTWLLHCRHPSATKDGVA
jgi:hypothetical protein